MRDNRTYHDNHHRHGDGYRKRTHRSYEEQNHPHKEYKNAPNYNRRINKHYQKDHYNNYYDKKKYRRDYRESNPYICVQITNLDYTISKNDLIDLFSNVSKVVDAWINYDHTDRSDGTAVCVFENIDEAQKALDKYDGSNVEGSAIKMEIMHKKMFFKKKEKKGRCPW